ncbi:hypothetical protein [Rhodopirellula baltica]|uniref:hypothetical protein n=1 Tax=Rhodopirellula baltica TaxID=265606 RepID=UPI0009DB2DA1|nr:hypothetical protein [Rhodopirellula baltica]
MYAPDRLQSNPYQSPEHQHGELIPAELPRGFPQLLLVALCILFCIGSPAMIIFRIVGILAPYARYGLLVQWLIVILHFGFPIAALIAGRCSGYHKNSVVVSVATWLAGFQFVLLVIFAGLAYLGSLSFR